MSQKILSLCIPTYNREEQLKRLLDSIVTQKGFTDEVEIVIADGPSKDGTTSLIHHYQKQYKNIRYYRNEKNIGMTAAFLEVIGYSEGQYTWLIGSDDQLSIFSLETLLPLLKKEHPKLVLSNLFFYKENSELKNLSALNSYHGFDGFEDLSQFMGSPSYNKDRTGFEQHFTFISVFCFETKFYQDSLALVIKDKGEKYINAHYFNFAVIVYYTLQKGKIILFDDFFVLVKASNVCMWKFKKKIYTDLVDLTHILRKRYTLSSRFCLFQNKINRFFMTGVLLGHLGYRRIMPILEKSGFTKTRSFLLVRKVVIWFLNVIARLFSKR